MQQLDLFGSLFNNPAEQKPEEKKAVVKKQDKAEIVTPVEEAKLLEDTLPEEVLKTEENEKKEIKKERENRFLFDDHLVAIEDIVSPAEVKKIEESLPKVKPDEVLQVEINPEKTVKKAVLPKAKEQASSSQDQSIIFSDGKITVKLKSKPPVIAVPPAKTVKKDAEKALKVPQKRGRKSFKEIDSEIDLIEVPEDDVLFSKQYYPISEVAKWFRVNTSLLRFWENEFDVLKPRKNRKGDRLFRPEDVKNLQLIYQLLRQRKYTIEGAKEYMKTNRKKADLQLQLTQTLQKFKSFLLDLKANLQP
jgi:DNA-binding transcriptional MerR regulator/copper chaperone CopZ